MEQKLESPWVIVDNEDLSDEERISLLRIKLDDISESSQRWEIYNCLAHVSLCYIGDYQNGVDYLVSGAECQSDAEKTVYGLISSRKLLLSFGELVQISRLVMAIYPLSEHWPKEIRIKWQKATGQYED